MQHNFNIPCTVTTEQCRDVLTTATDTGGINYWELPFRKRVRDKGLNCISFEVRLDDSFYSTEEWVTVDETTVVKGLERLIANRSLCAEYIRNSIIEMMGDDEDGISMCDLEQADVILQIGLFGELVYG